MQDILLNNFPIFGNSNYTIRMENLPTPILGKITALTIASPDLEASLAYYRQLGFSEVFRADWPFPWIQVSDGVLLIMLRKDPKPYIALTYYVDKIDSVIKDLEAKGIKFEQKPKKTDTIKRYLFRSPDGLNISLVSIVDGFYQPKGPGMLQMPPEDYFRPEKYVNKVCGLFGELAHPVTDLEKSIEFWELLGFKAVSRFASPYPWAIISDGLSIVGLHQTNEFAYPAITYFAADMGQKIAALKKVGLKNFKEKGPSEIVLTTPEEQHIFLFNLGGGQEPAQKELITTDIIETERLLLKVVTPEVMDKLHSTYSDEDIMSFLGLNDMEELEVEKNKWRGGRTTYRSSFKLFLMVSKETGKVIGQAGFHNWYAMHQRSEMGYNMKDDGEKRKGYMKEAVAAIIAHGFEQMGLNRIEAMVSPHNVASLKVVRGFGFTEEGTLREHFCSNGVLGDSICFSLLKREYEVRGS